MEFLKKTVTFKNRTPYLIIDKPTETTYILKDNNKEQITIHRNHIVPYYPKEKHIKLELQNYLLTENVPTIKQLKKTTKRESELRHPEKDQTHQYNLRRKKITLI